MAMLEIKGTITAAMGTIIGSSIMGTITEAMLEILGGPIEEGANQQGVTLERWPCTKC